MTLTKFPIETEDPKIDVTLPVGVHVLELTVKDSAGLVSAPDTVIIHVVQTAPSPPVIEGIEPASGKQGGELEVVISGENLEGANKVVFLLDGQPDGTIKAAISPSIIEGRLVRGELRVAVAISAAAVPGPRSFAVTTPAGTAVSPRGVTFTVEGEGKLPVIEGIEPVSGKQGDKLEAAIYGANLEGAKEVVFLLAGEPDRAVVGEVVGGEAEKLAVVIRIDPAAAPGARTFTVTTPAGTAVSPRGVTFTVEGEGKLPVIEGIEPVSGKQGDKLEAAIYGANLEGAKEVVFLLAGEPDRAVVGEVVGGEAEKLAVVIYIESAAAPGARTFAVTTPAGTAVSPRGVTFTVEGEGKLPVIEGIEPVSGKQGDKLEAAIYGANLEGAKEVVFLLEGEPDKAVVGEVVEGDAEKLVVVIYIESAAAPGAREFAVTTPAGTAVSLRGVTFTVEGEAIIIPRLVNEVSGIGPVFTERLKEAGVTELGQMVALGSAGLAEVLGVSEERALGFIKEAKRLLGVPEVELLGRSVQEVSGIGPATATTLAESGITDLAELAALEPARLAEILGISEERATGFVKEANGLVR